MCYINCARYLPEDTPLETERVEKPRENYVQILQGDCPSLHRYFSDLKYLSVHALDNVAFGEKLLEHHGNMYKFHGWSRI